MRVALVTAFWQRPEVTRAFCRHYALMADRMVAEGVDLVLIAAHSQDQDYLDHIGAGPAWTLIEHENRPLVSKFNATVFKACDMHVDAVIVTGSDDFMSDGFVLGLLREAEAGAELVGSRDIYYWRRRTGEAFRWPGYTGAREGEPIGAGRLLTAGLLDRWCWKPWPDAGDRGLDGAMWHRAGVVSAVVVCKTMAELGGAMVDVKDDDNMTEWESVRRAEGAHAVTLSEIECDDFVLPFRSRVEEVDEPWFDGSGDVALAMIARARDDDEMFALRSALFSARGVCRRACVVLDASSKPFAAGELRRLGCEVSVREWDGDFSAAREAAAALASGAEWLVVLDADEELEAGDLADVLAVTDADGVWASVHIWTDEGKVVQPRRVRAYRPLFGHWERPVHNQLVGLERFAPSTARVSTSYVGCAADRAHRQIPALLGMIQADPEDAEALAYLARALRIIGEYEQAAGVARKAVDLDPDNPARASAWYELIVSLAAQGDFGGAWVTLTDAIPRHPGFSALWQQGAALSLMAWAGCSGASAYDGIAQVRHDDLNARIGHAARLLGLPVVVE